MSTSLLQNLVHEVYSPQPDISIGYIFLFSSSNFPMHSYKTFSIFCCCCSVIQLCLTLCDSMNCSTPGFLVVCYLPQLAKTHIHWVSDAIQPSQPLLSPSPLAFNLSLHQSLFNESALRIRWPNYRSFGFSISSSNEYSGLISFRMDWLDLLVVQGIPKSLLQDHSSKASILWHSAFFMVQFWHPYMTTGKTIALTIWNFVRKVILQY